jgi:hypothetical protein
VADDEPHQQKVGNFGKCEEGRIEQRDQEEPWSAEACRKPLNDLDEAAQH